MQTDHEEEPKIILFQHFAFKLNSSKRRELFLQFEIAEHSKCDHMPIPVSWFHSVQSKKPPRPDSRNGSPADCAYNFQSVAEGIEAFIFFVDSDKAEQT
jgi:hypothetical protein